MDGPSSGRPAGPAQRKIITRSQSLKRKSKSLTPVSDRVQLERVLGFTCNCNATLACDPNTGLIAYPAGCVVVLLNPKKNKQTHIQSKKTVTCLAFSGDGRHLVTGECGYQPMVRVWDVEEKTQVGEFAGHKFGINCVVFSPNLKYIVSIGSQHDMGVIVWNWKTSTKLASNKVASKVTDISFSEDGSYFVTVGNRHVKFWYLDTSKSKVKEVVPLNGRSGILGEQRNNFFCGVACGRGANAAKTFAITQSGLLCEFNEKRLLDKWVELRVSGAQCLTVSEQHIYSGCAEGVVRVFSASTLHYVTSLPKPHYLGVDVTAGRDASHMPAPSSDAKFPDSVAIRFDINNKKVTTVYNDHSMYVWDVSNLKKVGKTRSYMYHSACIWGVEVYPELEETKAVLPPGSFITCSSDNTIRIWNVDGHQEVKRNIYSQELLKVIYTDQDLTNIKDVDFNPAGKNDKTDTQCLEKNGVRCVKVSPDGQHLASGDRMGNIRVHELHFMDQIQEVEAHDSEVLCLEFTRPETGVRLLASASRDRLIHVFDMDQQYGLVQTLDDHSSAITAVHFAEQDGQLHMLSCGADKSILFRTAQQDPEFSFVLNRHLVGRTTLYDMDIDVTHKFVATACQDRNVRIYNIKNGKQKKSYKGSNGDDGTLIKVQLDPSGGYVATSCSNKTLAIMDFFTGECVSTMFGHSELVTGVRFTNDLKHLISVAADGCIFVWRLPLDFTQNMTQRMVELGKMSKDKLVPNIDVRRGTFVVNQKMSKSMGHLDNNENQFGHKIDLHPIDNKVDSNANEAHKMEYRVSMGQLPTWAKRTASQDPNSKAEESLNPTGPRGRWAQRVDNQGIIMKSMLDENSAIQLSLAGAMDRRRYTVEQDSIQEQIKAMRETIKTDKMVPIITDDDETNKDDDDDDEFCNIEKRLNGDNNPNKKLNEIRRGSDDPFMNHKSLLKTGSIDLLLDDGEDEEEEEEDEGDADSDQKEVIYFPPDGDGSESSDTIASSFRVYEGDTTSYKDAESEGTDPLSLSDDESAPPTPTTTGDPIKDFISQAERDFENLGQSPALTETFTNTLEDLEENPDPSRYFSHRLSISSRFISRTQTQHLRNLAMAAQRAQSGTNGGWKPDEDAVPEKDQPNPVSQRQRPKLEPPPPPSGSHLARDDVPAPRTRHSLGTEINRRNNTEDNKDFRSRRSMDSAKLSREWKSMADMSGRITPTLTKPNTLPARSRTPTSYRSTTPHRNHSPVRYVAKTEMKLDSTSRGRSLSTKDEDNNKLDVAPTPRSKSATPLETTSTAKRKSLPKQHSYAKPTESSKSKTGPTTSPGKGRFANKKAGGKLNSAMKSKFKSTPDLASSLKTEEFRPMPISKTTEDISELTLQNKKTVRRSMPATREMKDPFGVNTPAVDATVITSKAKPDKKTVSIGESKFITETKTHRKLPTPGVGNAMPPPALVKSNSDMSIASKTRASTKEDEDRLKMPPPSLPLSMGIKRSKEKDLTLAEAKAILQGETSAAELSSSSAPNSAKSSPEKDSSAPVPVPQQSWSPRSPKQQQQQQQQQPQQQQQKQQPKEHKQPLVLQKSEESTSLDVPLEGSPDKDMPETSMFSRWSAQEVMPLDLPVKDQSPSRFSWSTRRFGRMTGRDNKPDVGECDDGGADIGNEEEPAEGDANMDGDLSSRRASEPVGLMRPEHSQSPLRDSLGSTSSTASSSSLTSPMRTRASLPHIPARDRKSSDKPSPGSSGSTSPAHGSPRLSRRHLRRGDEGPVMLSQDLQVAFSGDFGDTAEEPAPPPPSHPPPPIPSEGGSQFSIPKSKSMPEVGADNKALEELCQSVTAKLDALANKPLPGRSPKASPQSADKTEAWRKRLSDPTPSEGSTTRPDTEGDASEVKRPDKSRTMPPTSLTTSLPNATQSNAKLVLTSPAPADRSRLSLPVNKVAQPTEPEPDDDACKKAAADLQQALDKAIQIFNKVPKEKGTSNVLKDSLLAAQTTLNDTLGSTTPGASGNVDTIVQDTARQAANQTAQELSEKLLDILKSKLEQALQ